MGEPIDPTMDEDVTCDDHLARRVRTDAVNIDINRVRYIGPGTRLITSGLSGARSNFHSQPLVDAT